MSPILASEEEGVRATMAAVIVEPLASIGAGLAVSAADLLGGASA